MVASLKGSGFPERSSWLYQGVADRDIVIEDEVRIEPPPSWTERASAKAL